MHVLLACLVRSLRSGLQDILPPFFHGVVGSSDGITNTLLNPFQTPFRTHLGTGIQVHLVIQSLPGPLLRPFQKDSPWQWPPGPLGHSASCSWCECAAPPSAQSHLAPAGTGRARCEVDGKNMQLWLCIQVCVTAEPCNRAGLEVGCCGHKVRCCADAAVIPQPARPL